MSKRYKVTKKQIIKALETEDLNPGYFFKGNDTEYIYGDNGKCQVCAVGAVLRATKKNYFAEIHAEELCDNTYAGHEFIEALYSENIFSILSTQFEKAFIDELQELQYRAGVTNWDARILAIDYARAHAICVVEGLFPDIVEFSV